MLVLFYVFLERGYCFLREKEIEFQARRKEITNFFQSIPEFQESDEEDVETWMARVAEDCGFQMLNDDEIVISVQEEPDPVDDKSDGQQQQRK
ncbi:uncharacterized protein TNCV_902331 [Trichonephila clavipes]|nr:uncharacterized protein TNCV_902331 [Trichonephila clavipes]